MESKYQYRQTKIFRSVSCKSARKRLRDRSSSFLSKESSALSPVEIHSSSSSNTCPFQFDLCTRICHLGTKRKCIDGSKFTKNRKGCNITNSVITRHCSSDSTRNKLCFVKATIIAANTRIRLFYRTIKETYFRILNRYLQCFLSQRGCCRENDLCTIFNCLLDYEFCLFRGRHSIIATNFYFLTKYLFYVFFPISWSRTHALASGVC